MKARENPLWRSAPTGFLVHATGQTRTVVTRLFDRDDIQCHQTKKVIPTGVASSMGASTVVESAILYIFHSGVEHKQILPNRTIQQATGNPMVKEVLLRCGTPTFRPRPV